VNALVAEKREATGKGVARKLRAAGRIPAVVYGRGKQTTPISIDSTLLEKLLQGSGAGMNTLIELSVDGETATALVKELQRDPVRGRPLHTDFYLVDMDKKVEVSVPLLFTGKAKGVDSGGILDHPMREIELECLPRAIPEKIEVDVSALEIGDSIHVRDLVLPEGVEMLSDANLTVASVITPAVIEEPTAEAAEGVEEAAAEGEAAEAEPAEGAESKEGGD